MRTTLGARTARRYAEQFGWSIARGHYASESQSAMPCCCGAALSVDSFACSCGSRQCAAPGCHPAGDDWVAEASNDPTAITRLWGGGEWWPIALTGVDFDAVVVEGPLPASVLARVEHHDKPLGLTLTWRDEWHAFLTTLGAVDDCSVKQRDGVRVRSAGCWVPLPAAALHSPARWAWSPGECKGLILNGADVVLSMLPREGQREEPVVQRGWQSYDAAAARSLLA